MTAKCASILALAAVLAAPTVAISQQMTPKDINYLAHLSDSNRPYYDHFVMGVARFTGTGVVEANGGQQVYPMLEVDMGNFGTVQCLSTNGKQSGLPMPSLKPGDRVNVSGSVGGASTAANAAEANRLMLPNTPPLKVKDVLDLLTGTCAVEKVN